MASAQSQNILPIEDDDISKVADRSFSRQGIKLHASTTCKAIEKTSGGAKVTLVDVNDESKTQEIEVDVVLVAVGVGGVSCFCLGLLATCR